MSYWLRELAGWILLGLGLVAFFLCFDRYLPNRWIVEAFVAAGIGIMLFRGGLHLLKVAMAAKAARDIKQEVKPAGSTASARKVRPALASAPAGRPRPSLVPGPAGDARPAGRERRD
jgi:hypothetical protein